MVNWSSLQTCYYEFKAITFELVKINQRTNGPVNAQLISGPRISTKYTKPGKNKVKK